MDIRFLCLLCVVYVAVSATGRVIVQRSPTEFVCLIMCDIETSKIGGLGPIRAAQPKEKKSYNSSRYYEQDGAAVKHSEGNLFISRPASQLT